SRALSASPTARLAISSPASPRRAPISTGSSRNGPNWDNRHRRADIQVKPKAFKSLTKTVSGMTENPFFEAWDTPFELPPFDRIRPEHFPPAFDRGMAEHIAEIAAI